VCSNIEGKQTTLQPELFVRSGSNCTKPGTTVSTPPPAPPVAPTIEVRYIPISKDTKFTVLDLSDGLLQKKTSYAYAPVYRINFGSAINQPITFNVGYCVNHGIGTKMTVCKGLPRAFQPSLKSPDVISDWAINGLIPTNCWAGTCVNGLTGQINPAESFGRHQITIPAGTVSTDWMLHTNPTWTEEQKWDPAKLPGSSYSSYYAQWLRYAGDPSNGHTPDMTNIYFFNITDPENKFTAAKLENKSKPDYKLIWVNSPIY